MTFTAAGTLNSQYANINGSLAWFFLTTSGIGNFVFLETIITDQTCLSVSGGGCAFWTQLGPTADLTSLPAHANVWAGQVTSTGGSYEVDLLLDGNPSGFIRVATREFSTTTGGIALDVQGSVNRDSGGNWASLTPAGSHELYWGFAQDEFAASEGVTSGFTYEVTDGANGEGFCTDVSAVYQPTWGDSGPYAGIMVLVQESGAIIQGPPITGFNS